MTKYLILALLAVVLAGSWTQAEAGDCCIKVPKECVPVLRIPAEDYVPDPAMLSPPEPVPYSVWYYNLSDRWACVPVGSKPVVAVKASF